MLKRTVLMCFVTLMNGTTLYPMQQNHERQLVLAPTEEGETLLAQFRKVVIQREYNNSYNTASLQQFCGKIDTTLSKFIEVLQRFNPANKATVQSFKEAFDTLKREASSYAVQKEDGGPHHDMDWVYPEYGPVADQFLGHVSSFRKSVELEKLTLSLNVRALFDGEESRKIRRTGNN